MARCSRIAFRVASQVDSRTIIDGAGAEMLLGNGDMLFIPPGKSEASRLQGAYLSSEETEKLMGWYEAQRDRRLDLALHGHHQVRHLVDDDDDVGQDPALVRAILERDVGAPRRLGCR